MARKTGSHSDITGPRVRQAARRLFARHGFAAVSMRQIAREVGVQAGALYLYTPDKEALLFDLLRDHMEELLAGWSALPVAANPLRRLEDFVRFHIRFNIDRPEAVFLSYMELRNLSPDNFAAIEGLRRRYEGELAQILQDGATSGDFAVTEPKLSAFALIAMLTGVNTWFREGGRLDRAAVEEVHWDMARRAVGG
ncbi:TetR/AcrR family transcriptional regulator [Paracoccus sp. p4-l81]|uniref:TetR/AcrR family transcriptional regulator n=1 Tax=unclassified Paracoccus (in: a-proteobacteria) TaxID=2688777 RepID=UPI0035BA278E